MCNICKHRVIITDVYKPCCPTVRSCTNLTEIGTARAHWSNFRVSSYFRRLSEITSHTKNTQQPRGNILDIINWDPCILMQKEVKSQVHTSVLAQHVILHLFNRSSTMSFQQKAGVAFNMRDTERGAWQRCKYGLFIGKVSLRETKSEKPTTALPVATNWIDLWH